MQPSLPGRGWPVHFLAHAPACSQPCVQAAAVPLAATWGPGKQKPSRFTELWPRGGWRCRTGVCTSAAPSGEERAAMMGPQHSENHAGLSQVAFLPQSGRPCLLSQVPLVPRHRPVWPCQQRCRWSRQALAADLAAGWKVGEAELWAGVGVGGGGGTHPPLGSWGQLCSGRVWAQWEGARTTTGNVRSHRNVFLGKVLGGMNLSALVQKKEGMHLGIMVGRFRRGWWELDHQGHVRC